MTKKRFDPLKSVDQWISQWVSKMKYRNLVFKGGGVRGIAYMGALTVLEQLNLLSNIERVAGSSAGALAALLVSFRSPVSQISKLFDSLDMSLVPQTQSSLPEGRWLRGLDVASCPQRLFREFGWYSSEYFYHWLQTVIALQCEGNGKATFADFHQKGFRDLYVVVSNLSRRCPEVYSYSDTPDTPVADVVRISMSIPLYFQALRYDGRQFGQGDLLVDGGLFDNYPVHLFDTSDFSRGNFFYRNGVNWETLGLYIYPESCDIGRTGNDGDSLLSFIDLLVDNLYASHQVMPYANSQIDQRRTIRISDCGIRPTQFNVRRGTAMYDSLFQAGKDAVMDYFKVSKKKTSPLKPVLRSQDNPVR